MQKIICFIFGHRVIKGLFEDDEIITNRGCSRCGHYFMTSRTKWKALRNYIPPSGYRGTWEQFCDEQEQKLREEFKALTNH